MSDELDKLAQSAGRAEQALKSAAGAAGAVKQAINGIGAAVDGARDDINTMSDSLKNFSTGTLGAVQAVADGWRKVGDAIAATTNAAVQGERHAIALRNLGGAYEQVAAATRGAVTAEQALKAQQTLTQAGLELSLSELATVTRAAREYARALGTETPQALDQLVDALRTGEANGLARFGVHVDANASAAERSRAAIEQLAATQTKTAPTARSLGESQDALSRAFEDAKGKIALALTESVGFRESLDTLIRVVPVLADGLGSIVSVAGRVASAIATIAPPIGTVIAGARALANAVGGRESSGAVKVGGPQDKGAADALGDVSGPALGTLGPGLGLGLSADVGAAAAAFAARGRRSGGGGGGGGPSYDEAVFQELQFRVNELANRVRGTGVAVDRVIQQEGERLDAFLGRQTQAIVDAVGGDADRVIRHRGEEIGAFVGRQLSAIQTASQNRLNTIKAIDEAVQREHEEQLKHDAEYARQLEKINAQVERAMARGAAFDGLLRNPERALNREADQLREQIKRGELTTDALNARIEALKTEALAAGTTDREAEALQRKAEMLAHVREEMLDYAEAQAKLQTESGKTALALETFHVGVSSTIDKTLGTLNSALGETFGALLDGQEITGEVLRKTAHNVTKSVAVMALTEGTLELGRGLGKLAASYGADPTAYGHFAAAGVDLGMAAAFGLASYATRDMSGDAYRGGSARNQSSAYDRGSNSAQGAGATTMNFNFNSATYGTTEELQDAVVRGLAQASRRGNVPNYARQQVWVG